MPLFLAPAVALFVCACTGGQTGAVASTPASAQPTAGIQGPAVMGAPVANSGAGLSCRVPVSGFSPGTGGFVTFPGGKFVLDPASNVAAPANTVLTGGYGYDRAVARWLPVPWDWVSSDGSQYAYADRSGAVHVVDARSGSDRTLGLAPGTAALRPNEQLSVLDFSKEGIYLIASPKAGGFPRGLWLADPATGAARQLTDQGAWQHVDSGSVWGSPIPQGSPGAETGSDELIRFDPKTSAISSWYRRPGSQLIVIGFHGDRPVVLTSAPSATEIWIISAPGNAVQLYGGPGQEQPGALHVTGPGIKDGHGLWLGSPEGLLLYSGGGLQRMSATTGWVAGVCS